MLKRNIIIENKYFLCCFLYENVVRQVVYVYRDREFCVKLIQYVYNN